MQPMTQFVLAVLALLLTPGPTNTLLAVSGASVGLRRSLPLIAGEICGYLTVIVPLVLVAAPWLQEYPHATMAIKLCSASWVLFLAFQLWNLPADTAVTGGVTVRRIFVTTCLNPKALIIALVLMPAQLMPYIAVFTVTVVFVALVWLSAGAFLIRHASKRAPEMVRRVAAAFLLMFSAGLAGNTLGIL